MSWKALAWAAKCQVKHSADKLVLLGLAERHNEESGTAYPSVDWLSEFGSLNRKTVITSLGRLEELGLISDSGDRKGRTLQVKAYSLNLETVPISVQSQKRNSSDFSGKESQKRDTEPSKEPIPKKDKPSLDKRARKLPFVLPAHIPAQPWADFEEMRKRIGKGMTDRAKELAVERLDKLAEDGWPPGDVLNHSTLNSYQGLFPPKDDRNGRQSHPLRGAGSSPEGLGVTARAAISVFGPVEQPSRSFETGH